MTFHRYVIHASARRGLTPRTPEERVYRKLLEMEEALLMCEEFQKEAIPSLNCPKEYTAKKGRVYDFYQIHLLEHFHIHPPMLGI